MRVAVHDLRQVARGKIRAVTSVSPVAPERLHVTRGTIAHGEIRAPTFRAIAPASDGDAGELRFELVGPSERDRALASGELRRQVGLELRAANTCNVIYVMWRIAPAPGLSVQIKHNPGMRRHGECGARGYHDVAAAEQVDLPPPQPGRLHALRAEIRGDELVAWVDGTAGWRGALPAIARDLAGPAGLRSDNVRLSRVQLLARPRR
jgi:hypothetical protein